MRSYEAARGLFSFLGFCAWASIVTGVIVALVGATAVAEMSRYGGRPNGLATFTGLLPGLAMSFVGFIALALVQIGRAAVDTAEYTQQMLGIARDQLEVSRQGLNQGKSTEQGFAALKQAPQEKPAVSFADATRDDPSAKASPSIQEPRLPLDEFIHRGRRVRAKGDLYIYDSKTFKTENDARLYIDALDGVRAELSEKPKPYAAQLGVNDGVKLGGVTRS